MITKDEAISLVMTSDYLPESNPYENVRRRT